MACAWGGVAGYGTAMLLSYFVGQKKYPINYDIKGMFTYVVITVAFYYVMDAMNGKMNDILYMLTNTVLILAYLAMVVMKDMPLSSLPVIGKRM